MPYQRAKEKNHFYFFCGLQDSCPFLSSKRAFRTPDKPEVRRNNGRVCMQHAFSPPQMIPMKSQPQLQTLPCASFRGPFSFKAKVLAYQSCAACTARVSNATLANQMLCSSNSAEKPSNSGARSGSGNKPCQSMFFFFFFLGYRVSVHPPFTQSQSMLLTLM